MEDEPAPQSIKDRIAALNLGEVGRPKAPPTLPPKRPGIRPPIERSGSANLPPASTTASRGIGNQPNTANGRTVLPPPETNGSDGAKPSLPPRLPPRTNSSTSATGPSPSLPPRRPSGFGRRDSQESTISTMSALSTTTSNGTNGRSVRAPSYDPGNLPLLPQKKKPEPESGVQKAMKLKPGVNSPPARTLQPPPSQSESTQISPTAESPLRKLPPTFNSMEEQQIRARKGPTSKVDEEPPPTPQRKLPPREVPNLPHRPPHTPQRSPNPNGFPSPNPSSEPGPPPIPTASKPNLSAIMSTKPRPNSMNKPAASSTAPASNSCLHCRDFSVVDEHAAQFPRQNVSSIDRLAYDLTAPFPSLTDKARAIFTWLHHNVDYNVEAFFNNNVKPSTPNSTLQTGLAVCEGYAGLFSAIAAKAGLESVVVGGHGKGFGFATVPPEAPTPPPDPAGHAWSAVRIDNGEWKLLDACWGAGHISGPGRPYTRAFNPVMFTADNAVFGLKHFPANPAHFYLPRGTPAPTWASYVRGPLPGGAEPVLLFSDIIPREGLAGHRLLPPQRHLSPAPKSGPGPRGEVQFRVERVCAHWDPARNGPDRKPGSVPLCLALGEPAGGGGQAREMVAMKWDADDRMWWLDVEPVRLGRSGEKVALFAVETIDGRSARGTSQAELSRAIGRRGMSWAGIAQWIVL